VARLSDRVVTGAPNGILSNDEPIQWYAADGVTLIDGIKVDATGAVYLAPAGGPTEVGGDLDVTGALTVGNQAAPTAGSTFTVINNGSGVIPDNGFGLGITYGYSNEEATFWNLRDAHSTGAESFKWIQKTGAGTFDELMALRGDGRLSTQGALVVAGNISGPNSILMSADTAETIRVTRTGTNAASAEISTSAGYGSVLLTDAAGTGQKIKAFGSAMRFDNGSTTLMTLSTAGLDVAGTTTSTGGFNLPNNVPLRGVPTTGGTSRMLRMNTSNVIEVGSTLRAMDLNATTTTVNSALGVAGTFSQEAFSSSGSTRGVRIGDGYVGVSSTVTSLAWMARFHNPNGAVGQITTSGSVCAFTSLSDPRTKSEFTPITGASEMILEARDQGMIGEFTFLADPTQTVWGYNAHKVADLQVGFGGYEGEGPRDAELGSVYEEAVMGERPIMIPELDAEGNPTDEMIESGEMESYEVSPEKTVTPAGIDQSKRVPILEAAIGELLDRIAVLEALVDPS